MIIIIIKSIGYIIQREINSRQFDVCFRKHRIQDASAAEDGV